MLAAKPTKGMTLDEYLSKLRLPLWETPKIDGIRAVTLDIPGDKASWYCTPLTRHMKPVPNAYVRGQLGENCPPGLDGELVVMEGTGDDRRVADYYTTSSAILAYDGQPDFRFMVFDYITPETRLDGYLKRIEQLKQLRLPSFVEVLQPQLIRTVDELHAKVNERMDQGFEGSCLRTGVHEYKFGRSSLKQQGLVAVKLFVDSDADVTAFMPLMRNIGEPERNARGHKFRKRRKENLVEDSLLGKLIGKDVDTGVEVRVGTGFTPEQRRVLWEKRHSLLGKRFKYKHQPFGALEGGKPREPVFLGFREQ